MEENLRGLDLSLDQVKQFHEALNHPVGDKIQQLDEDRKLYRINWMEEELDEFYNAENIVDEIDALIDLNYFVLGTFVEMGIKNPQDFFDIVQESNMQKLWPDGKPHYREDGKILKPSTWIAPEPKIKNLVETLQEKES